MIIPSSLLYHYSVVVLLYPSVSEVSSIDGAAATYLLATNGSDAASLPAAAFGYYLIVAVAFY